MEIDLWTVLLPIGLTALALLLTGPGMWSESWGWSWLDRLRRKPREPKV